MKIKEGSFGDLAHLNLLDIRCIRINEIDANAFKNANQLEKIVLSINPNFKTSQKIENLQHFEHATNLKELSLTGFTVEINKRIYLSNLTHLSLESCAIKKLHKNSFANLSNLESLNLRGNHLNYLENSLFKSLIKLKSLNLSYNQMSLINSQVLVGLSNVEAIDFSYNFLSEIKSDSFCGLAKLRKLNFHRNFLKSVVFETFKDLSELEELDLSFNKFVHIESNFFHGYQNSLNSLVELRLDMNRLNHTIEPEFFSRLLNLKYLYLGNF